MDEYLAFDRVVPVTEKIWKAVPVPARDAPSGAAFLHVSDIGQLLDLQRCWRDTHALPDAESSQKARWWLREDDIDLLARLGLYRLGSLAKQECLFLLGRPGAGKTSEIERLASGQVEGFADECCVAVSCKEIGPDVDREVARVPEWRTATQQSQPIRLILDALDEGYLRDASYFNALKLGLRNLRSQHPGLRLLLVCRPAEWDATFGKAIHDIWHGPEEPKVYALEPLSPTNQSALVESWGVPNTTDLFGWIRQNDFEEFAAWPRSLKWLADQFCTGETQQITYTELCKRRTMRSFPEEDRRIEEAGRIGRVEIWTHALMLVAAAVVFCGRRGIALDGREPTCLMLDEMFQAANSLSMPKRPVLNRVSVREAIRASDLIEGHGTYHRFQNQSDLEYLAAAMLVSLEVEQLSELFGSSDDVGRWRVFPQLATTAANLASQSQDFFDWVLEHDPRVLMRVDFASKSADVKGTAINAILNATMAANATAAHDEHAHFSTLRNPLIEEQLRPWLYDDTYPLAVRDLTFDIAFACCGAEFWIEFDHLVSAGTDEFLQSRLPSVIIHFGRYWPEERLQELAALPNNRMAGAAMGALLDQGWKPGALAPFLREPTGGTVTSYDVLLSRRIPRACEIDDVPLLLSKVTDWSTVGAHGGEARTLAEALIAKAVTTLDREDVRQALVRFISTQFRKHDWFFHANDEKSLARLGLNNADHRRSLILTLSDAWFGDEPEMQAQPLNMPLLPDDHHWLLGKLPTVQGRSADALARLASSILWNLGDEYAEEIDHAYSSSSELRALYPSFEGPSFFAQIYQWRLEAEDRRRVEMDKYRSERQHCRYSHEEHLTQALAACRAGDPGWWTDVCYALSQPHSLNEHTNFIHCSDVRELAGWQAASDERRTEMARFARRFLLDITIPEPAPRQIPESFFGLVYALSLHAEFLASDEELRRAIKPLWAQALLRQSGSKSQSVASHLTAIMEAAPAIAALGYEREFREVWDRDEPIFGELYSAVWSAQVEDALVRVLEVAPIQPASYESGINMLLEHNPTRARELARSRLVEYSDLPDSQPRRAAVAVCLFTINSLWEDAWPHFVGDLKAARQLVIECRRWLDLPKEDKRIAQMPTAFVAELYKVMLKVFPLNAAPRRESARFLGPEDEAYDLQSALKDSLEQRGEYKALQAAFAPYADLQNEWWVGRSLERAKMNAHTQRRTPPTAIEFIRFLVTEGGIFVRDNDTLQNAVMASLRRFEKQLHPLVITSLWEGMRPRNEGSLQVEITRHLKSDFEKRNIVVNMEVKVEGKQGVDILVEAVPYSVIIEIKQGHATDKNRPLRESMRLQLRDTYLANSRVTHGIYVVGWYFCPAYRPHGLSGMKSLKNARDFFERQASHLSVNGFSLVSIVLDCRWKESITARAKKAKSSRHGKNT